MPNGVITFQRYALPYELEPKWSLSTKGLSPMNFTASEMIEDIDWCLQVNTLIFLDIFHRELFLG